MAKKLTTEEFIERAKKVHGDRYDYSKTDLNNKDEHGRIQIICSEHGIFYQLPTNHLNGCGCKKCGVISTHIKQKLTTEEFIEKAKKIHGDKYDYSLVNYTGYNNIVKIICPKHGIFEQIAGNHLNGENCFKCGKISMANKQRKTLDEFIEEAKEIHGDKYDYSNVQYTGANDKIIVTCPIHGDFTTTPSLHTNAKCGCPKCGRIESNKSKMLTTEEFIEKAKKIHGDKYDYSLVNYTGYDNIVKIICPKHGIFEQTPDSHLQGKGCQKCGVHISNNEDDIFMFCKTIDKTTESRNRKIIYPFELDIFVKDKNIGIEYNGLLWHSDKYKQDKNYHLKKLNACKEKGIKLLQIFEDEYINHKDIVLNKIKHIIGKCDNLPRIPGRKCEIKEIDNKIAKEFLDNYHIQGFSPSTIYLGAYYNNELIAVMTFKQEKRGTNKWELTRFASNYNYVCQGVGGKLFKYFIRNYNSVEIKSFADRRWTVDEENNIYIQLGFKFGKYTPPDYRYYKRNGEYKRIHKFNFRKQILHKKYDLPLTMTETEMTEKLDFLKIYDCGLIKYIWNKEN